MQNYEFYFYYSHFLWTLNDGVQQALDRSTYMLTGHWAKGTPILLSAKHYSMLTQVREYISSLAIHCNSVDLKWNIITVEVQPWCLNLNHHKSYQSPKWTHPGALTLYCINMWMLAQSLALPFCLYCIIVSERTQQTCCQCSMSRISAWLLRLFTLKYFRSYLIRSSECLFINYSFIGSQICESKAECLLLPYTEAATCHEQSPVENTQTQIHKHSLKSEQACMQS